MSGLFWLDWVSLSVSLAITMLLVWLGMVVWLNSEQRTWGIHLTSSGLLIGAFFFATHSVLLALANNTTNPWLDIWWRAGWIPVILSPFTWYLVVLWYAGFWESKTSALHRRQLPFLYLNSILTFTLLGLLAFSRAIPSYWQSIQLDFNHVPLSIFGIPILVIALPFTILLCLALAIDALLRPGPTRRPMADIARERARPWLLGSSFLLVIVSMLVGWVLVQLTLLSKGGLASTELLEVSVRLARYDLLIESITGLAIICLGQALVSYEIFTGKVLPRQGLRRYYYSAILLFGGIGALVAAAYTLRISAIYGLLLALLLMTGYFALLTWRSIRERDWAIRQLRPFVASQRLYEQILQRPAQHPAAFDAQRSFQTMCGDVLDTQQAALIACGPLASLVSQIIMYPPHLQIVLPDIAKTCPQWTSPERIAVQLEAGQSNGFAWAIPLWSERGLIGLLLLGNKRSPGFYTQEEIEVARANGERLLDAQAGIEIIRRMTELQREQMVTAQVIDRRTRRLLHDEILPALHTLIIQMNTMPANDKNDSKPAADKLAEIHRQISSLLRELPAPLSPDLQSVGLLTALQHLVCADLAGLFDQVEYQQDDGVDAVASGLAPLAADVIYYACREAIRNAAQHARSAQPLHLHVTVSASGNFRVTIEDNGVGISAASAINHDSTGQGLMLHSTLMAVIGGSLTVETKLDEFTRVILTI
jgi:signal transduction histidine kinase